MLRPILRPIFEPILGAALGEGVGVPTWRLDANLAWDFVNNAYYGGATAPTDTHAQAIYTQAPAGFYTSVSANVLTRAALGLQTVPTRANIALRSNDFGNAYWSKNNLTITTGADASGPIGAADAVVENAVSGTHQITKNGVTITANTVYDFWCLVKPGLRSQFFLQTFDTTFATQLYASFNLSGAGTIGFSGTGGAATLTAARISLQPSGYYLCELVGNLAGGFTSAYIEASPEVVGTTNYAGSNGSTAVNLAQLQYEIGTFASAPIVTAAASVTATQTQVYTPSQSYDLGAATEITVNVLALRDGDWLWQDNDGTVSNSAGIKQVAGRFRFQVVSGGVMQADLDLGAAATGAKSFAAVYGTNYAMAQLVGGTPPTAGTTVTMPVSLTKFNFGGNGYNATGNGYSLTRGVSKKFEAASAATFALSLGRATAQAAFFT